MSPTRHRSAARRSAGSTEAALAPNAFARVSAARAPYSAIVIGASTGGPQAVTALLAELAPATVRTPVLIVQHMPPPFTTIFAEQLKRVVQRPVREPHDGELLVADGIYVAPGGRHMRVLHGPQGPEVRLDDAPPVNFCRPAVDCLFASAAEVWGAQILGVILTGMGSDGTEGARAIMAAGGTVLAQDEPSSVVWGMPGSAARAGVCSAVLPLAEMAPALLRLLNGGKP
jgi:two-component system, chemotaxis family, protein-glutamate methylesterase/glutaminase